MEFSQLGEKIAVGNTADIYQYEGSIIKIFHSYLPDTVASYEGEKQQLINNKGVSVPKVLEITKINGRPALRMDYAPGKPIGDLILENTANQIQLCKHYFRIFVEHQIALHKIEVNDLEPMEQKLASQLRRASHLLDEERLLLLEQLEQMSFKRVICHGDLHPYNMLIDGDNVTIIDWVDATAGDLCADVYRTYLLIYGHSIELAELYLELYMSLSGISRDQIFKWEAIIAAARLGEHSSPEEKQRLLNIVRTAIVK